MDDADIEDVVDDPIEPPNDPVLNAKRMHPSRLVNETPGFLADAYGIATQFLQNYGWFVLFALILVWFLKKRFEAHYSRWQTRQAHTQDLHRIDSGVAQQRLEAMEASRRRLQEQYDAQLAKYAEEQALKEEEKRKEKIADWDRHVEGKGYRSKYKPGDESSINDSKGAQNSASGQSKKKNVYRQTDFNPLMGGDGGGGGGFRPQSRRGGGS